VLAKDVAKFELLLRSVNVYTRTAYRSSAAGMFISGLCFISGQARHLKTIFVIFDVIF